MLRTCFLNRAFAWQCTCVHSCCFQSCSSRAQIFWVRPPIHPIVQILPPVITWCFAAFYIKRKSCFSCHRSVKFTVVQNALKHGGGGILHLKIINVFFPCKRFFRAKPRIHGRTTIAQKKKCKSFLYAAPSLLSYGNW